MREICGRYRGDMREIPRGSSKEIGPDREGTRTWLG